MIILVGKSASGKTFIGKCLEPKGYKKIVTYTTRAKRPQEENGIDYFFISKEEFEEKINNDFFFEYVNYNGNYYGTSKNLLTDLKTYLILEPKGLDKYKNLKNVVTFYVYCDKNILKKRMLERKDKLSDVVKRLKNDEILFKDVKKKCNFMIDGTKNISDIIKEVEDKYYGFLHLATRNE